MEQRPFHKDIEAMRAEVVGMGKLAVAMLRDGVQALSARDPELATRVLARDRELDMMDVHLEARILELIALHQPMARDLRILGGSLKIITYLDRIGRYGYDIAVASLSAMETAPQPPQGLLAMADKAAKMVEDALRAYERGDHALAVSVAKADDAVDALYDEVFRACLTHMMENPSRIRIMTEYLLVARHLERAADNAVKVAEKANYIATGERRRRSQELPESPPAGTHGAGTAAGSTGAPGTGSGAGPGQARAGPGKAGAGPAPGGAGKAGGGRGP